MATPENPQHILESIHSEIDENKKKKDNDAQNRNAIYNILAEMSKPYIDPNAWATLGTTPQQESPEVEVNGISLKIIESRTMDAPSNVILQTGPSIQVQLSIQDL